MNNIVRWWVWAKNNKYLSFKKSIKLSYFALIVSFINLLFYSLPFYKFTIANIDTKSFNGVLILVSLTILIIFLNALVFYLFLYLWRFFGKLLLVLLVNINALAVYFINTYGVIIDITMVGNVFNTNYDEASAFFSFGLVLHIALLGILPSVFIIKMKTIREKFKRFAITFSSTLVLVLAVVVINSGNTLWIDKHSKTLGGLSMPWSYIANTYRFFHFKNKENKQQILLPDAKAKNSEKSIVVLVIGESARSQNFSLYGYEKETNPLLSKIKNVYSYKADASATYTTEAVKYILSHKKSSKLYEILPNYLFRNGFEVIWRTSNWGEPTVNIKNYQTRHHLEKECKDKHCKYDEILLHGLSEQILASEKDKVLVVLHTSTSHGPTYYKRYPEQFEKFSPVCESVELEQCTQEELINAYDNTIVYTDFLLASLIEQLKQLVEFKSSMLYVSDHGESLGENNLYMHGIPMSLSPKEQIEIPFIVWCSDNSREFRASEKLSQHHIFHSALDFLDIGSPIFDKDMSIFKE